MDKEVDRDNAQCDHNGTHSVTFKQSTLSKTSTSDSSPLCVSDPLKKTDSNVTPSPLLTIKEVPSDYVFGSNISSRVINADISHGASCNLWATSNSDESLSSSSVFTTLAKVITNKNKSSEDVKNLEDSAKEVVEYKRKEAISLAEVDVVTGEEGEIQIIRQHCRAYIFDANQQKWNSLGAANFHLNDIPQDECIDRNHSTRSRVVVRLASTRRVVINTLIWDQMPIALVDPRSLRICVVSDDGVSLRSYLFVFPPDESASKICGLLNSRKSQLCPVSSSNVSEFFQSNSNKTIVGHKRPLNSENDGEDEKHITPPKVSNTVVSSFVSNGITVPKTNLFRPSVLAPNNAAGSHNLSSTSSKPGCSNSEVQFRDSSQDVNVKRLTGDNVPCVSGLSKSSNSASDEKTWVSKFNSDGESSQNLTSKQDVEDRVIESKSGDICDQSSTDCKNATDPIIPNLKTLKETASAVVAEMAERSVISFDNIPRPVVQTEEYSVLKFRCLVFCFDQTTHVWIDRGSSYVNVNDVPESVCSNKTNSTIHSNSVPTLHSSLIIRSFKTQKLLVNLPIWSGLKVTMGDENSIRLCAVCCATDFPVEEKRHEARIIQLTDSWRLCSLEVTAGLIDFNEIFTYKSDVFCGLHDSDPSDTDSSSHVHFVDYLLVMRSKKEADCIYQALTTRMEIFKNGQDSSCSDDCGSSIHKSAVASNLKEQD